MGLGPRSSAAAQVVPNAIYGTSPREDLIGTAQGGPAVAGDASPKACGGRRRVRQGGQGERREAEPAPRHLPGGPESTQQTMPPRQGGRDPRRPHKSQDTFLALCGQQGHGFCLIPVYHVPAYFLSPSQTSHLPTSGVPAPHPTSSTHTVLSPHSRPPLSSPLMGADAATTLAGPSPEASRTKSPSPAKEMAVSWSLSPGWSWVGSWSAVPRRGSAWAWTARSRRAPRRARVLMAARFLELTVPKTEQELGG